MYPGSSPPIEELGLFYLWQVDKPKEFQKGQWELVENDSCLGIYSTNIANLFLYKRKNRPIFTKSDFRFTVNKTIYEK
jgi:hypothetical protein